MWSKSKAVSHIPGEGPSLQSAVSNSNDGTGLNVISVGHFHPCWFNVVGMAGNPIIAKFRALVQGPR